MDLKRLTNRAKDLVEKRGGADSAKQDAAELKDIASGKGSLKDKAKAAAEAIKQPGSGPESAEQPKPGSAESEPRGG
jgi:hypothetical protein